MSQIVEPTILEPGSGPDLAPIALESVAVGLSASAVEYLIVAPQPDDAVRLTIALGLPPLQDLDRFGRQGQTVRFALLGQFRRLGPDRVGQVEIEPAHAENLAPPAAGQSRQRDRVDAVGPAFPVLLQHRHQPV